MIHNPYLGESFDVFYENNKRLILFIANRYRTHILGTIVDYEDLVQIAYIGFQRAYERYVPVLTIDGEERPIRFSTFAVPYMGGEILRALENQRTMIKYSRQIQDMARLIYKEGLEMDSIPDIAKKLQVSEEQVIEAFDYSSRSHLLSLDYEVRTGEEEASPLSNLIPIHDDLSGVELLSFFDYCDEREKSIIQKRMNGLTQYEIAAEFGISQVQVGRILKKIKQKYENSLKGVS